MNPQAKIKLHRRSIAALELIESVNRIIAVLDEDINGWAGKEFPGWREKWLQERAHYYDVTVRVAGIHKEILKQINEEK